MDQLIIDGVKVDAIITDPPYWTIKNLWLKNWTKESTKWDDAIDHKKLMQKCNELLKPNGVLILFGQEPYTSQIIKDAHYNIPFSYRMIWKKDHFANWLCAKKAPVNYYEDICVFFKKSHDESFSHPLRDYTKKILDFIWISKKEIFKRMEHQGACHFLRGGTLQFSLCTEKTYKELITFFWINLMDWFMEFAEIQKIHKNYIEQQANKVFNLPEGKKSKSNILEYKKDYTGLHPTQKPVALMEDLVKTYTNKGDLVLDFTMWSWSTGVACQNLDRDFIWIELDDWYFNTAEKRLNNF